MEEVCLYFDLHNSWWARKSFIRSRSTFYAIWSAIMVFESNLSLCIYITCWSCDVFLRTTHRFYTTIETGIDIYFENKLNFLLLFGLLFIHFVSVFFFFKSIWNAHVIHLVFIFFILLLFMCVCVLPLGNQTKKFSPGLK